MAEKSISSIGVISSNQLFFVIKWKKWDFKKNWDEMYVIFWQTVILTSKFIVWWQFFVHFISNKAFAFYFFSIERCPRCHWFFSYLPDLEAMIRQSSANLLSLAIRFPVLAIRSISVGSGDSSTHESAEVRLPVLAILRIKTAFLRLLTQHLWSVPLDQSLRFVNCVPRSNAVHNHSFFYENSQGGEESIPRNKHWKTEIECFCLFCLCFWNN